MYSSIATSSNWPHWRSAIRCLRFTSITSSWRQAAWLATEAASRTLPPGRRLHRPYSQGRETRRPAGPAGNESRTDHQPQDRQGARHYRAAVGAKPRRRGDRIEVDLSMSAIGTKRTSLVHRKCLLLGVKRTCLFALHMSAYDPKRTLGTSRLALVWPLEGWISKHSARL